MWTKREKLKSYFDLSRNSGNMCPAQGYRDGHESQKTGHFAMAIIEAKAKGVRTPM